MVADMAKVTIND